MSSSYNTPSSSSSLLPSIPQPNSTTNSTTPPSRSTPLTCSGHTRPVVHLEFSDLQESDGTYLLLSSCKDGNPMLRDWLGDWVGTFLGHKGAVWNAKLSGGEGAKAVTGSADFSAKVWDTFSGQCLHTFAHEHIVRAVGVDAPGTRVFTGGHEKKLRLFDLNRPEAEAVEFGTGRNGGEGSSMLSTAHDGVIKSIVWPRAQQQPQDLVVSMGDDKIVRWWDVRAPRAAVREKQFGDGAPITSMERSYVPAYAGGSASSNGGSGSGSGEVLTICSGKTITFLDALDPDKVHRTVTLQQPVSSASLHPTQADRFIAGSTADGWVRIYDFPTTGDAVAAPNGDGASSAVLQERELHKGHHGPAHIVSYSPDGELAASGSEDGTIRLWQTYPGKKYGLWV